jgi:hypothetical protein
MEGFDPGTSFGYDVSKSYDDPVNTRGDEEQTVAFLAGLANGRDVLEFAASSTSWPASPAFDCARDGEDGTVSHTPPTAGATLASMSELGPERLTRSLHR